MDIKSTIEEFNLYLKQVFPYFHPKHIFILCTTARSKGRAVLVSEAVSAPEALRLALALHCSKNSRRSNKERNEEKWTAPALSQSLRLHGQHCGNC